MSELLDLAPRWWRQEVSALTDVDAGLLFDGTCSGCKRRRGVRVVEHDLGDGSFYVWCTKCLLVDHPLSQRGG